MKMSKQRYEQLDKLMQSYSAMAAHVFAWGSNTEASEKETKDMLFFYAILIIKFNFKGNILMTKF